MNERRPSPDHSRGDRHPHRTVARLKRLAIGIALASFGVGWYAAAQHSVGVTASTTGPADAAEPASAATSPSAASAAAASGLGRANARGFFAFSDETAARAAAPSSSASSQTGTARVRPAHRTRSS